MLLKKGPTIKCKKCYSQYDIDAQDFEGPETVSDERNMGYEIQYTWEYIADCEKCRNEMNIVIEGYEYPEGVFNYQEFTAIGCIIINDPELEIQHFEDDDESN